MLINTFFSTILKVNKIRLRIALSWLSLVAHKRIMVCHLASAEVAYSDYDFRWLTEYDQPGTLSPKLTRPSRTL